jgi:hypothetical protein
MFIIIIIAYIIIEQDFLFSQFNVNLFIFFIFFICFSNIEVMFKGLNLNDFLILINYLRKPYFNSIIYVN